MSNTLLYLGDCIVNLAHIVKADFKPASAGGEERYDEDSGQHYTTSGHPASLRLTLTALESEDSERDYDSGFHLAAASRSQVETIRGDVAEQAWDFLRRNAVGLARETEVADAAH